jgi:hypothetical protein
VDVTGLDISAVTSTWARDDPKTLGKRYFLAGAGLRDEDFNVCGA